MLSTWTQNSGILNSAALRMLGVKEDEPDPGGWPPSSQDIFRAPTQDLPRTESVLTMVGGHVVYDTKVVSVH
jgi:predicted amidohydrolase YtcJ